MSRLIAVGIYGLFVLIWEAFDQPRRVLDVNRTLKWVARRLGGTHLPTRRDRPPAISWDVEKTSVLLSAVESARGRHQGYALRIRQPCRFHLRLTPEYGWARVRRFFGAQDLQVGDALFDRAFLVQTDSPSKARPLLNREVRVALTSLTRLGPVSLDVGPVGITIRTTDRFDDQLNRLIAFSQEALEVARALLRLLDPGFLNAEVVFVGGSCPVCSTPVVDDRRECARCRTAHHNDCWNYLGGCAVFACAGRGAAA